MPDSENVVIEPCELGCLLITTFSFDSGSDHTKLTKFSIVKFRSAEGFTFEYNTSNKPSKISLVSYSRNVHELE